MTEASYRRMTVSMKLAFSEFPRLQFISYTIHTRYQTSMEENEHTRLTERNVSKKRHEQTFH